jgi:hypothetical protein
MKPETIEIILTMFKESLAQLQETISVMSSQANGRKEIIHATKLIVECEKDFIEHVESLKGKSNEFR